MFRGEVPVLSGSAKAPKSFSAIHFHGKSNLLLTQLVVAQGSFSEEPVSKSFKINQKPYFLDRSKLLLNQLDVPWWGSGVEPLSKSF